LGRLLAALISASAVGGAVELSRTLTPEKSGLRPAAATVPGLLLASELAAAAPRADLWRRVAVPAKWTAVLPSIAGRTPSGISPAHVTTVRGVRS
jgi:hypothetical protein